MLAGGDDERPSTEALEIKGGRVLPSARGREGETASARVIERKGLAASAGERKEEEGDQVGEG